MFGRRVHGPARPRRCAPGATPAQCGIALAEPRISAVHATFKLESGQLIVRDEHSNNGTLVNNNRPLTRRLGARAERFDRAARAGGIHGARSIAALGHAPRRSRPAPDSRPMA